MRFVYLVVGVLGVASAALFARAGMDAGSTPLGLSAWRLLLASAALLLYRLIFCRNDAPFSRQDIGLLAVAGLFLGLHFATWIASLAYISVARSTLLVATSPLWAGLAAYVLPVKKPGAAFWVGLAIAAAGTVAMATSSGTLRAGASNWKGDVLALIGAAAIVPYLYASQKLQAKLGSLRTITGIFTAAGVVLWIACFAAGQARVPTSSTIWIAIIGMAIFAQLVGHSFLNVSLRFFSAGQVASTTLLEPIFAALLAWPILGEAIGAQAALGGAVMLAGVGLTLKERTEGPAELDTNRANG